MLQQVIVTLIVSIQLQAEFYICIIHGVFSVRIFFYVMVALFIYVIILVTCTICGNVSSHHINAETVLYLQVCLKKNA